MAILLDMMAALINVLRPTVFVVTAVLACAALLVSLVDRRRISPFSAVGRLVRRYVDPLFAPMERRLLLIGGQPSHAPWWTVLAVMIAGLITISALQFVVAQLLAAQMAGSRGVVGLLAYVVGLGFACVKLAIIARVIASFVGGSPYSPWWRWAFTVSDPILRPLRRVLPTVGPLDLSPLVAYFLVSIVQQLVLQAL